MEAHLISLAAELNCETMLKYIEVQGMIAENENRQRLGASQAYVEADFSRARDELASIRDGIETRKHNY